MLRIFSQIQYGSQLRGFILARTRLKTMASGRNISQSKPHLLSKKITDTRSCKQGDLDRENQRTTAFNNEVDLGRLSDEEKEVYYLHLKACQKGESTYKDPATGYAVFTEVFHKQRNSCCGNACRHCPYNHESVPPSRRTKAFNSAFYYD